MRLLHRWPLNMVAATSFVLLVARAIWPSLRIDEVSVWLLGIGAAAIALQLVPLTRLKVGDFEAEFNQALAALEAKVVATEESPDTPQTRTSLAPPPDTWRQFFTEYTAIVNSPASNLEKLVSAAILMERVLESTARAVDVPQATIGKGPIAIVDYLHGKELISAEERSLFREFWQLRNQVVHGHLGPVTDAQAAKFLDLGWRLIRTLA